MPTLTLRNIPEGLYARLKARAAHHNRSVDSELLRLLEDVLPPPEEDEFIALAKQADAWFDGPLPDLTEAAKRDRRFEDDLGTNGEDTP